MAIQPLPSGQPATPPQNPNDPNDPTSLLMSYFGLDADTQPSPLASNMDPASPSDYLAALAGIPQTSGALTRGTMRDVSGNVSPDYTRSRYNEELDAQSQQFDAANAVRQAADDASARKQAEEAVAPTITAAGGIEQEKMREAAEQYKADQALAAAGVKAGAGGVKLNTSEQNIVDGAAAAQQQVADLKTAFEQKHPGIWDNPEPYSSPMDLLGSTVANAFVSRGAGASTTHDPALQTMINSSLESFKASLAKLYSSGRVSATAIAALTKGMPAAGFSDGENVLRTKATEQAINSIAGGVAQTHNVSLDNLLHTPQTATPETNAPLSGTDLGPDWGGQ